MSDYVTETTTATDDARAAFDARFKHYDGYKSPSRQADLFRVFWSGMEYCGSRAAARAETTTDPHWSNAAAAERQREIDNRDCPICGGDMLRRDYTSSDRCHAQRWPEWRELK